MEESVSRPLVQSSPVPLPTSQSLLSPSRLARLPPIATNQPDDDATHKYLENAKDSIKMSMIHMVEEAQSAETRMQSAVDTLWQKMLELWATKENDYKKRLSLEQEELKETRAQLQMITERETALAQMNTKMSVELVATEKQIQVMKTEISSMKKDHTSKDAHTSSVRDELRRKLEQSSLEAEALKKTSAEQSKIIKEYQEKVTKMTDKLHRLTKDLGTEKDSAQQAQKSTLNQINQKTVENKKLALEISKLKSQLTSSSSTLAASREEIKKLEMQLKNASASAEASITSLQKKHCSVVKSLEDKITLLQDELARQQETHEQDIGLLQEKLQNALRACVGDDDFMMTRIKFLQHQNKQEKVKLQQQKS